MNPSLYYWLGIVIALSVLYLRLKREQAAPKLYESFYTFFTPEIVAPRDPYPNYVIDTNAYSLMRFYPEQPRAVFWLWDAPGGVVNPWEWLRPFFRWMTGTVPLESLEIKRTRDWNQIMNSVSKNENHMALVPSWKLYHDTTTAPVSSRFISTVMNLFSYTVFAIVPYGKIQDPTLQLNATVFSAGSTWGVGPANGLSSFIGNRLSSIWTTAGEEGPVLYNGSWESCMDKFEKNELSGMLWVDVHPFPIWKKIQETLPKRSYILLPVQRDLLEIVYASVPFLQKAHVRLAKYDIDYLPMRVGARTYWFWNDALESIQFPAVWIANPKYSQKDLYQWIYTWMNQRRWREDKLLLQSQWTQANAFYFGYPVPMHAATEEYRVNFGLDSQQEESECVLHAGTGRCPLPNSTSSAPTIPPAFQPALNWPTRRIQ